jgi:hypothetical protein
MTKAAKPALSQNSSESAPLPTHRLRNGRLNQMAYSPYLFIRDVADGDLISWIDRRLAQADEPHDPPGDRTH